LQHPERIELSSANPATDSMQYSGQAINLLVCSYEEQLKIGWTGG